LIWLKGGEKGFARKALIRPTALQRVHRGSHNQEHCTAKDAKGAKEDQTFTAECAESAEKILIWFKGREKEFARKALIRPIALQRECSEDCVSSTSLQNDHYCRHHGCLYSHLTFSDCPVLGPA